MQVQDKNSTHSTILNSALIAGTFGISDQITETLSQGSMDTILDNLLVIIHKVAGVELHQVPEDAQSYIVDEVLKLINNFVEEFKTGYKEIHKTATEMDIAIAAGKSLSLLIDSL
jgi:hypothetical protein